LINIKNRGKLALFYRDNRGKIALIYRDNRGKLALFYRDFLRRFVFILFFHFNI